MIKLYLLLFYEFTKIGLFAIGGGYSTLPFLYYIQTKYQWFTIDELTNMIAVSNITPGPIGINMATYTGYTTAGIIGSLVSTSAIISIPFIISILMVKLIDKYKTCNAINSIFIGLRPAAVALLTSIGLKLLYKTAYPNTLDIKAIILFLILILPFSFMKKNPLLIILAGAIGGIIINSF